MKTDKIYKLTKSGESIMEIDSRCIESALDYFNEFFPGFYSDKSYNVEVSVKNNRELFTEVNQSSFLINHQLK
jgi:hypothetical protein